jgi:hypothetical protein
VTGFSGGPRLALLGIVLAIAACDRGQRADAFDATPWSASAADTGWVNIEGVEFPGGMEKSDPEILEAYVFAAKHPEVLQYMPCYCGCEHPRTAHESNYDCFVDIVDRSGAVPRVSPDIMGFS